MLIDGEKWACEACVRGHRVTTCKHHDRPLIRINRKGRPFSTCSVCNCTPCQAPEEHTKLRRFLPIAPRPGPANAGSVSPTALAPSPSSVTTMHHPSTNPRSGAARTAAAAAAAAAAQSQSQSQYPCAPGATQMMHAPTSPGAGTHHPMLSPAPSQFPLTGSYAAPGLVSGVDVPVSMAMMESPMLFDGYADGGVFSLEDLDVHGLPEEMLHQDWGDQFWLGDDSV
ncbi:putative Cu-dependent DNA-binding protein [Aspergillus clavatus NRRL 1]|uniref:Copper fist DNA binding domain protein n=1 Tax=Aspergillus clavatus (strain ATCC 1007 / CBS 513.65 / DSM 816 / NCTC 3887 / NRRL 1 / QM 1276 / 107) TaxID=344612 RepID=A1CFV1_ASPCL|nr:Copper fist DNA binding domain protein [Aspergillus clavatus NRRL 1]EAW11750.1 Copper fist DNA binding domain protein [Aspergillus clavatus NRRL 1]